MDAPYFVFGTAGDGVASGDFTVQAWTALGTILANDILIISVHTKDNVALTFPAGWTIIQEGNNGATSRSTVAWKRAVGADGSVAVTHPAGGAVTYGQAVYRGCKASGNVVNTSSISHNSSSSTATASTITTTVDGCLVFGAFNMFDAVNSLIGTSANLGYSWRGYNTGGARGGQSIADVPCPNAGAVGAHTMTLDAPSISTGIQVALEPEPTFVRTFAAPAASGYGKLGVVSASGVSVGDVLFVSVVAGDPTGGASPPDQVVYGWNAAVSGFPAAGDGYLMSQLGSAISIDNKSVTTWMLVVTATGTANVSVVFNRPSVYAIAFKRFSGVDNTNPVLLVNATSGTSNAPSGTITGTNNGNTILQILATSFTPNAAVTFTKNASQTLQWSTTATTYAKGGPYIGGTSGTTKASTGTPVVASWTGTPSVPWVVLQYEVNVIGASPAPDPEGETPTLCQLAPVQHRADHFTQIDGVGYASQLVPMGTVLGYAYAGWDEVVPPETLNCREWKGIYFRTYDPTTATFGSPITVEPPAAFDDPCGLGDSGGNPRTGSFWDKPNLLRLTDGRLICIYGMILGHDFPYNAPLDPEIKGGGVYARESSDNGATWGSRTTIASVVQAIGPAATDGTNVWVWSNKHSYSTTTAPEFVTYGNFDAPTFDMKLYKRSGVDSWDAGTSVYSAATVTRTLTTGVHYAGAFDGLEVFDTPFTNALVLSSQIGMVFGIRMGTAASTNPLAGPGTRSADPSALVCWRTTNGGTSWKEIALGSLTVADFPASGDSLALRARITPTGRIYVTRKQFDPSGGVLEYLAVFYSDDSGATWTDAGVASKAVFEFNPDTGETIDLGTDGALTMNLDTNGYAYVMGTNNGVAPVISMWISTSPVSSDPTTFEYFGCYGVPLNRVFGGWKQSDGLIFTDSNAYELEQFAYGLVDSGFEGREELWIISYPTPPSPTPPPTVTPYPSIPFHRGYLPTEPSGHPSGVPTVRRVGR